MNEYAFIIPSFFSGKEASGSVAAAQAEIGCSRSFF